MSHSVISTHLHSSPLIVIYLLPFSTTFARLHSCPFIFTPLQPSSCISTHLHSSPLIVIHLLPFSITFAHLHSCPFMFTPLQSSSCISTHLHSSPLIPIRLHRGLRESTEPGHLSFQLVENVFLTPPLKVNPPGILVLATGPPCCNCRLPP